MHENHYSFNDKFIMREDEYFADPSENRCGGAIHKLYYTEYTH